MVFKNLFFIKQIKSLEIVLYNNCSVKVNTPDCESGNCGSIPHARKLL